MSSPVRCLGSFTRLRALLVPATPAVTTVVVADGLGQLNVGIGMCAALVVTTLGVAALQFVWPPLRSVGTK